MKYKKITSLSLSLFTLIFSCGCLEEQPVTVDLEESTITSRILHYIESNGNYINFNIFPAFIEVEQLFNNSDDYKVVDIRSAEDFNRGHIPGAVNISNNNLFDFIQERREEHIVLVSASGQSASYIAALMRFYGVVNIFPLKFGMASWNLDFADVWVNALVQNNSILLNDVINPKGPLTQLPDLNENYEGLSTKEILEQKIRSFISEGLTDSLISFPSTYVNSINWRDTFEIEKYLICFCTRPLYIYFDSGHPDGAIFYSAVGPFDFRSDFNLQTLPTDKPIIIYSVSGQMSAMATAFLQLLGYTEVRSILFGAHNLIYERLLLPQDLASTRPPRLFSSLLFEIDNVKNYDYETGS